jgi:hypothetical protein
MKKITFMFLALSISLFVQAQQFQDESNTPFNSNNSDNNLQAVIWDQPSIGGSGIISDYSTIDNQGVYSADDFNLTESTRIDFITVYGFQNNEDLDQVMNGFDVFIYTNDSENNSPSGDPTQPGTGIVELSNISVLPIPGFPIIIIQDGGNYAINIDMAIANEGEVILPAGDYWLVVAARINVTPVSEGATRWNWFDAGVPDAGLNEAHLIDPDDIFGAGATAWTTFTNLGLDFASTAFIIEGEPSSLGVNNNISELASVYPNPTNGILNVDIPSEINVISSKLYNLLGQGTGLRLINGTLNVSQLSRGLYILNVETSAGTLTQKVVKN